MFTYIFTSLDSNLETPKNTCITFESFNTLSQNLNSVFILCVRAAQSAVRKTEVLLRDCAFFLFPVTVSRS